MKDTDWFLLGTFVSNEKVSSGIARRPRNAAYNLALVESASQAAKDEVGSKLRCKANGRPVGQRAERDAHHAGTVRPALVSGQTGSRRLPMHTQITTDPYVSMHLTFAFRVAAVMSTDYIIITVGTGRCIRM